MFGYDDRRRRLSLQLQEVGVDAAFLPISSDLEWATGLRRRIPNFGEVHQAHDWATGCFLRPDHDPIFVFTRMYAAFDLEGGVPGELGVINETDDGEAVFRKLVSQLGRIGTLAVGARCRVNPSPSTRSGGPGVLVESTSDLIVADDLADHRQWDDRPDPGAGIWRRVLCG